MRKAELFTEERYWSSSGKSCYDEPVSTTYNAEIVNTEEDQKNPQVLNDYKHTVLAVDLVESTEQTLYNTKEC
jgi:hypothetical protein